MSYVKRTMTFVPPLTAEQGKALADYWTIERIQDFWGDMWARRVLVRRLCKCLNSEVTKRL